MIDIIFNELKDEINELYDNYKGTEFDISEIVRDNALVFIKNLKIELLKEVDDIYPNQNGTLSFKFFNKTELEIGINSMSYFIKRENDVLYMNDVSITQDNIEQFIINMK